MSHKENMEEEENVHEKEASMKNMNFNAERARVSSTSFNFVPSPKLSVLTADFVEDSEKRLKNRKMDRILSVGVSVSEQKKWEAYVVQTSGRLFLRSNCTLRVQRMYWERGMKSYLYM